MENLIQPKTNWYGKTLSNGQYVGDYFNKEDYERIVSNINTNIRGFEDPCDTTEAFEYFSNGQITYNSIPSYVEFNKIYKNLKIMADSLPSFLNVEFTQKTFHANDPFLDFNDLNYIESKTDEFHMLNIHRYYEKFQFMYSRNQSELHFRRGYYLDEVQGNINNEGYLIMSFDDDLNDLEITVDKNKIATLTVRRKGE